MGRTNLDQQFHNLLESTTFIAMDIIFCIHAGLQPLWSVAPDVSTGVATMVQLNQMLEEAFVGFMFSPLSVALQQVEPFGTAADKPRQVGLKPCVAEWGCFTIRSARLRFHVAKMVLNANHEGCDSRGPFKLSPGSSEEFDHRKIAEADVNLLGWQLFLTLSQFDGTTERIVVSWN
jgi:hypothetical protein